MTVMGWPDLTQHTPDAAASKHGGFIPWLKSPMSPEGDVYFVANYPTKEEAVAHAKRRKEKS